MVHVKNLPTLYSNLCSKPTWRYPGEDVEQLHVGGRELRLAEHHGGEQARGHGDGPRERRHAKVDGEGALEATEGGAVIDGGRVAIQPPNDAQEVAGRQQRIRQGHPQQQLAWRGAQVPETQVQHTDRRTAEYGQTRRHCR